MIEAVNDGWWYVADTENSKVCIFFTDADLHPREELMDPVYLSKKRTETTFVKHRNPSNTIQFLQHPTVTAAASSNLSKFTGMGWLTAGDAAISMDPLSAHGITFALQSGIDAGLAAAAALNGDCSAATEYSITLCKAAQYYQEQCQDVTDKKCDGPASLTGRGAINSHYRN